MSEPNLDELEDFQLWRSANSDLMLSGYAYHNLSASLAIAVGQLLWPDLVSYRGGVFIAEAFSKTVFDSWSSQLDGNLVEIERAMNHVHLCDLANSFKALGAQNLEYLATIVSNCWRCRLKQAYPDHNFCLEVGVEPDGLDYEITFYHQPSGLESTQPA